MMRALIFFTAKLSNPKSWMELRRIGNPRITSKDWDGVDEDGLNHPLQMKVNPFMCTHQYIGRRWPTDHCHEYERHWEIGDFQDTNCYPHAPTCTTAWMHW